MRGDRLAVFLPNGASADVDLVVGAFPELGRCLDRKAASLSGGQQQMVAQGRCFSTNPAVVLLDEVSLGLAPRVVDHIFQTLGRLAESGVAILIVEQYVNRAVANGEPRLRARPQSDELLRSARRDN